MGPSEELNSLLRGTVVYDLLSTLGRDLYFPKGIVFQSAEAESGAYKFNATAGMAFDQGKPLILPAMQTHIPGIPPEETVPYAPTLGDPVLRKLWRTELLEKNPGLLEHSFSEPAVVPGLTAGVSLTADLFIDPEDSVFIPDLYWDNYRLIFETRKRAKVFTYPLFDAKGGLSAEGLFRAVSEKALGGKAFVILNFPNNPTGYTPTKREAVLLKDAFKKLADTGLRLLILCDDAYFGLVYEEDALKESIFSSLAGLHENILAVKADGTTKEDYTWGFRIGFLTFAGKTLGERHYGALQKKLAGALRSSVSSSSRLSQSLLIRTLKSPEYKENKRIFKDILKSRYLKVKEALSGMPVKTPLIPLPGNSGYFTCLRCKGINAELLRSELLEKSGIGIIAIAEEYIRIAFSSINEKDIPVFFDTLFKTAEALTRQ